LRPSVAEIVWVSKYKVAKQALGSVLDAQAGQKGYSEAEAIEALLVVAVEAFARAAGPKRAAESLSYELDNLGGNVDTVFLRSR
jgi:hypothetical protein